MDELSYLPALALAYEALEPSSPDGWKKLDNLKTGLGGPMSDEVTIYPPDVEGATRVIKRWLYGRKMATRLGRFCMTISDLGEVDLHSETLKDIYDRGFDDGIKAGPGTTHSDPEALFACYGCETK